MPRSRVSEAGAWFSEAGCLETWAVPLLSSPKHRPQALLCNGFVESVTHFPHKAPLKVGLVQVSLDPSVSEGKGWEEEEWTVCLSPLASPRGGGVVVQKLGSGNRSAHVQQT